jgi:hypothetical protein
MKKTAQAVATRLFAERRAGVFAVLDGASVPDLPGSLYRYEPEHECLYRGELAPDLIEVAPYLVRLEPDARFTRWVLDSGWGNHWGIFAVSYADLRALRRHFRTFLMVHDSDAKPMYFRYYDPRVLRAYLPTCNAGELDTMFGPVASYILEGEKAEVLLRFQSAGGKLVSQEEQLELET